MKACASDKNCLLKLIIKKLTLWELTVVGKELAFFIIINFNKQFLSDAHAFRERYEQR